MENIFSISKISNEHANHCEDSHFTLNYENYFIGCVLDGCSTGVDSHFASMLIGKLLKKELKFCIDLLDKIYTYDLPTDDFIKNFINQVLITTATQLRLVTHQLNLEENELLSTIVLAVYIKPFEKLFIKIIGDGGYLINQQDYLMIHPKNNMPEYLAYHLVGDHSISNFINNIEVTKFENVSEFSIFTDGLEQIKGPESSENIIDYLLKNKDFSQSKIMLQRKFNILTKNHHKCNDDVSIIRYF